ncbi:hypothetical protein GCM10027299_06520 [Larkinella ripae]
MSPYKIFISYSSQNTHTAQLILANLQERFAHEVKFYLSGNDIGGGDRWMEELKANILDSDAVLSLVTPSFNKGEWFFIEWTYFWLFEKPIYLLLTEKVEKYSLKGPLSTLQYTELNDLPSMQRLLQRLHTKITGAPPENRSLYDESIRELIQSAIQKLEEEELNSYEIYRHHDTPLPSDFPEIEKILTYFYQLGDTSEVINLISRLQDRTKGEVALVALEKGQLDVMKALYQSIDLSEPLYTLSTKMVDKNGFDREEVYEIVSIIGQKNQAASAKLAEYMINNSKSENTLFPFVIENIHNKNGLERVLLEYLKKAKPDIDILFTILTKLIDKPETYAIPALKKLAEHAPHLREPLRQRIEQVAADNKVKKVLAWLNENIGNQDA